MGIYIATSADSVKPGTIFVDSHIKGADLILDHHLSGEKTNLDLMLHQTAFLGGRYQHIASTHIDTDSVLSSAVLVFGTKNLSQAQTAIMRAACQWCDHLICDLQQYWCDKGLMLHHYLKQKESSIRETISGEQYFGDSHKTIIFNRLVNETIEMLRAGKFKEDHGYMKLLNNARKIAKNSIIYSNQHLTAFRTVEYLDPIITYTLHNSNSQIIYNPEINHYNVGIHPAHYNKGFDLRKLIKQLNNAEKKMKSSVGSAGTWGGRTTVFGSPRRGPGETSTFLTFDYVKQTVGNYIREQSDSFYEMRGLNHV